MVPALAGDHLVCGDHPLGAAAASGGGGALLGPTSHKSLAGQSTWRAGYAENQSPGHVCTGLSNKALIVSLFHINQLSNFIPVPLLKEINSWLFVRCSS